MSTNRQIGILELLNVDQEKVPANPTVHDLRKIIAVRIHELMLAFPPGSFVEIRNGEVHLIKAYQGERDKPTAFLSESKGADYNPNIEELGKAIRVDGPDDPDVQAKAVFWRERHAYAVAIREALERIARRDRYGLLNFTALPVVARNFIEKTWPVKKTDMGPPEVDDTMIIEFLEKWMEKRGIRLM